MKTIFGREPAVWAGLIGSALTLLGTLGFDWFDGQAAALWTAGVGAAAGAIVAWATKPVAPGAVLAVVAAATPLWAYYGLHLSDATIGAVNGLLLTILALQARAQVTPEVDPRPTAVI